MSTNFENLKVGLTYPSLTQIVGRELFDGEGNQLPLSISLQGALRVGRLETPSPPVYQPLTLPGTQTYVSAGGIFIAGELLQASPYVLAVDNSPVPEGSVVYVSESGVQSADAGNTLLAPLVLLKPYTAFSKTVVDSTGRFIHIRVQDSQREDWAGQAPQISGGLSTTQPGIPGSSGLLTASLISSEGSVVYSLAEDIADYRDIEIIRTNLINPTNRPRLAAVSYYYTAAGLAVEASGGNRAICGAPLRVAQTGIQSIPRGRFSGSRAEVTGPVKAGDSGKEEYQMSVYQAAIDEWGIVIKQRVGLFDEELWCHYSLQRSGDLLTLSQLSRYTTTGFGPRCQVSTALPRLVEGTRQWTLYNSGITTYTDSKILRFATTALVLGWGKSSQEASQLCAVYDVYSSTIKVYTTSSSAPVQTLELPIRVWKEGAPISRAHFIGGLTEHLLIWETTLGVSIARISLAGTLLQEVATTLQDLTLVSMSLKPTVSAAAVNALGQVVIWQTAQLTQQLTLEPITLSPITSLLFDGGMLILAHQNTNYFSVYALDSSTNQITDSWLVWKSSISLSELTLSSAVSGSRLMSNRVYSLSASGQPSGVTSSLYTLTTVGKIDFALPAAEWWATKIIDAGYLA